METAENESSAVDKTKHRKLKRKSKKKEESADF
jgi:hypothetical protein